MHAHHHRPAAGLSRPARAEAAPGRPSPLRLPRFFLAPGAGAGPLPSVSQGQARRESSAEARCQSRRRGSRSNKRVGFSSISSGRVSHSHNSGRRIRIHSATLTALQNFCVYTSRIIAKPPRRNRRPAECRVRRLCRRFSEAHAFAQRSSAQRMRESRA
jgi:hypothetical protein